MKNKDLRWEPKGCHILNTHVSKMKNLLIIYHKIKLYKLGVFQKILL